jgi:hypothetical protein
MEVRGRGAGRACVRACVRVVCGRVGWGSISCGIGEARLVRLLGNCWHHHQQQQVPPRWPRARCQQVELCKMRQQVPASTASHRAGGKAAAWPLAARQPAPAPRAHPEPPPAAHLHGHGVLAKHLLGNGLGHVEEGAARVDVEQPHSACAWRVACGVWQVVYCLPRAAVYCHRGPQAGSGRGSLAHSLVPAR